MKVKEAESAKRCSSFAIPCAFQCDAQQKVVPTLLSTLSDLLAVGKGQVVLKLPLVFQLQW